jgi:phosphatidylethanolamine/phosphatidyl-N-methylethanolamine N-methyltransferase
MVERLLSPLSRLLGFHPDLCLDNFVKETNLEVVDIIRTNLFGYWKLVRARNNKQSVKSSPEREVMPKVAASQ